MFLFRLAGHLGKSVRQLLASMDSAELTEWQAYYSIEPFGPNQEDLRSGTIAAVTFNSVPRKEGTPAAQAADFFHSLRPPPSPPPDQTEAEQLEALNLLAKAMAASKP